MRQTFCIAALWALIAGACGSRLARTADEPPTGDDAGSGAGDAATDQQDGAPCPSTLRARLTTTSIALDDYIRYKRPGYDYFPTDERIAYSVEPGTNLSRVAWLDNALASVHVTPLTEELWPRGPDTVVTGSDIGGLVAQADGFALLTRRDDPGTPLVDPNVRSDEANYDLTHIGKAAVLVRYRQGAEVFAAPLTGTASIVTGDPADHRNDCISNVNLLTSLNGRLAFNGLEVDGGAGPKYGAYFAVHGCIGDFEEANYGDKLVYVDDSGNYVEGGWDWGCSISDGVRLLPEVDAFTSLCVSESMPFPGLDLFIAGMAPEQLSPEWSFPGYVGGQFGSVVKMGDGTYVVGWLSRGVTTAQGMLPQAARTAPDIAITRLSADRVPSGSMMWLTDTPSVAEANLHLAPYGPDRLVVIWDSIENLQCSTTSMAGTCFGQYTGTHIRLITADGTQRSDDEAIDAPPNSGDDLAVFPNGDLGWAFVPENPRDYSKPMAIDTAGVPEGVPLEQQLTVAHLRYCRSGDQ